MTELKTWIDATTSRATLGVVAVQVTDVRDRMVTARVLEDGSSHTSPASVTFMRKLGFKEKRRS